MSNAARKPLSTAAIRAIAIRKSIAQRTANPANDNAPKARRSTMSKGMLAACVEAGGFDQNARFA